MSKNIHNTLRAAVYPTVALLSLLAAFSAHAEWGVRDVNLPQAWNSTTTRAEVRAELARAQADGSQRDLLAEYSVAVAKPAPSATTREAVRAETQADRATHYADYATRNYGEGDNAAMARVKTPKAAAPVLAQGGSAIGQ